MMRRAKWMRGRFVVRPLQGRVCFAMAFRGLAPTAIHVHPLRGWGIERGVVTEKDSVEWLGQAMKRGSSPEAKNMNSRG